MSKDLTLADNKAAPAAAVAATRDAAAAMHVEMEVGMQL